ncbi:glycosyltransferase [Aspergillus ibericus CBS 121593]|uniref:UDP-Glycosyltransferase/glycogen phosphorylase n=1 Tax=Aspergillus ibericus CBS 121593 TaxID=1448316 RepID=A0A395GMW5_9EURO|nr:UDP-Glycosyltransferase/glycogen phosphorylase [Aspergillus ibericus CBS 121593]RAK96845.1 UDP-Glycosyltransferase/glycogen phosphorylase [Aspergillus ibericus CBS 121593]
MADKPEKFPQDNQHAADISEPPPAYSPPAYSTVSSEVSLWTVEPDFAPYFTNESHKGDNVASADDNVTFDTHIGLGPRTSAFIQAFMRLRLQPRLVHVGTDSTSLQGNDTSIPEIPVGFTAAPMDIVIMVVGENVDPFILIAKRLHLESHRVRIAAHASCERSVRSHGLDFFAISHDLIHPMSIHSADSAYSRGEDLQQLRQSLFESYHSCWRACIATYRRDPRPFLADAIIASPLAHAHIHCAQRLSIPLHIMSTMLWSSTREFPHPLAQVDGCEEVDERMSNLLSYALVEERETWATVLIIVFSCSIIEPINRFRQQVLGFQGISSAIGGRLLVDQEIPHTYLCSEVLIPRPKDWSSMIGPSPIYLNLRGEGMESPDILAKSIQDTVLQQGFRVILSGGCRDLGPLFDNPHVFSAEKIPHEWLLPRVSVIVHHGNSDDTASALRHGTPSVVIPHSGEQLSRGIAISKIGAAAAPLLAKMLSSESLSQAIAFCLRPDIQQSTQAVRNRVIEENGLDTTIQSFYRWLPSPIQKCSITQQDLAMYHIWNKPSIIISPEAAAVLLEERRIKKSDIVLIQRRSYIIECDKLAALHGTARDYWDGVTHAAKRIATSSDLISTLPGLQRKVIPIAGNNSKDKRNLAKDVGISTARFFGHIALLPFTIVNSVTYGVKAAAGDSPHNLGPSHPPGNRAIGPSTRRFTPPDQTTGKRVPSSSRTSHASQIQVRDEEHVQAICRRHLERGYQSPKRRHAEFREMVRDRYQGLAGDC